MRAKRALYNIYDHLQQRQNDKDSKNLSTRSLCLATINSPFFIFLSLFITVAFLSPLPYVAIFLLLDFFALSGCRTSGPTVSLTLMKRSWRVITLSCVFRLRLDKELTLRNSSHSCVIVFSPLQFLSGRKHSPRSLHHGPRLETTGSPLLLLLSPLLPVPRR